MKKLCSILLALAMIFALCACGSKEAAPAAQEASKEEVFTIKFAGSMPVEAPSSKHMEAIKAYCEEKSGGRLQFELYPANQLGDATLVFEDIQNGNVDMGCFFNTDSYDQRIAINSLPYLVTDTEEAKKVYSPGSHYFELYKSFFEPLGVKILGVHGDGFVGLLFNKYPEGYNDATAKKDLMMRMSSTAAYMYALDGMGYNSVTIPFSDLYTSLQTGVCDGAIGLTPVSAESAIGDQVKYWAPMKVFIDPLDYSISMKTWEKLPEDLQAIIQEAVTQECNKQFDEMEALDQEALDKLVAQGTQVLELTDAEFDAYVEKVRTESWARMAESVGQDVIDEIKKDLE